MRIEIGKLYDKICDYKNIKGEYEKEIFIGDLNMTIFNGVENTNINYIIKKKAEGIKITFDNNKELICARKHILYKNGLECYADELKINDYIDGLNSQLKIKDIQYDNRTDFYDISVDYPYVYYDDNGIKHHNTVMIAALAKKVSEKGKFIIIVPAKDLAIQTKGTLEKVGLDVGIVGLGYREFDHKVIICTWQTINSMERRSKSRKVEEDDRLLTAEEKRKLVNGTIGILFDECLDENTLITMGDGSTKRIKDCTVGDKVIVYNEEIKEFAEDEVESVYVNLYPSKEEDMYEIEMEDNTTIKITGNHKVLTNRGWLMVKELTENDEIIDYK